MGVILRPSPFATNIILEVPAVDEFFNFILKHDTPPWCDQRPCRIDNICFDSSLNGLHEMGQAV